MLVDLRVGGLESCGQAQRSPLAPLTVLIGANASGKSNLIEAMQLLACLARSQWLGSLAHALGTRRPMTRPLRARACLAHALGTRLSSFEASPTTCERW